MSNNPYANFVLENKFESQLTTKIDLANYLTADYSLTASAGMKKTIHKYKATGAVEDLAQGVGNSGVFEATYASEDYTVGVTQGKGQYFDEEAMKDPMIVDTITKGMAEAMVNDFTSKAIAEMIKTQQTVECDFSTTSSGYLFGQVVDGAARVADLSDLRHLDDGRAHLQARAERHALDIDAAGGDVLGEVAIPHIESMIARHLDGFLR